MDFMKGIVILLKVDKMYNILKSLLATVISRDMKVKLDDQSFWWSLPGIFNEADPDSNLVLQKKQTPDL